MNPDELKSIKPVGLTAKFVNFFLENKQLTIMLLVITIIGGAVSFSRLRVEGFPAVEIPVAVMTTVVPGAGPETINNTVTVPLENALRDLKDLKEVSSTSQANVSIIVLNFNEGTDVNLALQEARTKISGVDLPDGINQPEIIVPDISGAPFYIAVSGATDLTELGKQAQVLEEKLLALKGVKSFNDISGVTEQIYIELAPQYQTPQVIEQIKSANVGFPLGESVIDGKRIPITGQSGVLTLEDVRNISVTVSDFAVEGGVKTVKLADIASVYLGIDYDNQIHRVGFLDKDVNQFKIQPALLFDLRLEPNTDLLSVGEDIQKLVREESLANESVDYAIVLDQSSQSKRQVDEIVSGAIGSKWSIDGPLANLGYIFGGLWLLIIAMLLFLDWRSALISTLAMPLSLLITFIALAVMDVQLNTLVLFSLVLVIGLIVDPAIVVLESIKRYMEVGFRGKDAVLRSVEVIGVGLFIAVFTSLIVFVPFSLVSGTFGELIKYIPLTVFPALIASYFIPLIFLTWLGEKYLKANTADKLADEDDIHTLWPIARWFIRVNRFILARTWLSIVVIILSLVVPIVVTAILFSSGEVRQVQFSQPDDSEYIQLSIPRPANQTYDQLQQMAVQVENILKPRAGLINTFFYQSIDGTGSGQALSLSIELLPAEERAIKSPEIVEQISADLKKTFGERALASELSAGPPTDNYPISVRIFDNDANKLATASGKITEQFRTYEEIELVVTDNDNISTELVVRVDQAKASQAGITAPAVYGQVAGFLGENRLFRLGELDVIVKIADDTKPNTISSLQSLIVYGSNGPVRLGDIVAIEETIVSSSIRRFNGERYLQVSANVKDARDGIAVQREITDWTKANAENLGLSERAFEDRVGVNEFEKSFQELFMAIAFAIVVTYLIFVLFFRSFIQPFIILFAIPLILIGVFPSLALFANGQFGFLEIIGIIMVIGIVENVAIFLIDYANRKVREGMDKKEAVALASGIRFRAIALTQITTLVGLLPLTVFSPFWRGLALVVIFGIISSGLLSLLTTPILYVWLTRHKKKVENNSVGTPLPFNTSTGINYSKNLPNTPPSYPV